MRRLKSLLLLILLLQSSFCYSQAYKYNCASSDDGWWTCQLDLDDASKYKPNENVIFGFSIGGKKEMCCIIAFAIIEINGRNNFNDKDNLSIKFYLSNGEVLTSVNQNTQKFMWYQIGTQSLKSNYGTFSSTIEASKYAMSKLREYNITKISIDGKVWNTPNFRSAATIDAMCKTLITKTGDQGQYGKAPSGNTATTPSVTSPVGIKAVFHGTRVGKVYHLADDSRDKFDLFFQCNVSVYGTRGEEVMLTAYVDGPTKGKGLYAPNGRYKTTEGNVAISGTVTSRTDNDTQWPQYTLILPFSDLCLPDGTHTINVRWFAKARGAFIGNSVFQTIHFTKRGKEITNFYVEGGEATPGYY